MYVIYSVSQNVSETNLSRPGLQLVKGKHGGSGKGSCVNLSAYATKQRLEEWHKMSWGKRSVSIINTARRLGCEWPSERGYKGLASLCMFMEKDEIGVEQRHECYLIFKKQFCKIRNITPRDVAPISEFPDEVAVFVQNYPGRYKAAMGLLADADLVAEPKGLPV